MNKTLYVEYFGFCEYDTQCFVTSSLSEGATSEATYADFYTGAFPTCVEDGDYIFDHYCDAGEWGSRTGVIETVVGWFKGIFKG